jgi:hypothetical protein
MIKRSGLSFLLVVLFVACVSCGGGGSSTPITVVVTAPSATATVGTALQFTATVTGTTDTAVTWQVNGQPGGTAATGTISSSGSYLATTLPSPATVTITAVSQADATKSGSLAITIQNGASNITVSVSPAGNTNNPVSVPTFATQTFTATVTGTTNTAVTWSISCSVGGTACGAIGSSGNYVAPNSVPTLVNTDGSVTNDIVTVTATSQASGSASGSSAVYVLPLNQNALTPPVQLGSSGSNVAATCIQGNEGFCFGGTLGSLLTRGGTPQTQTLYIMSNNHVLGLADAGVAGQAVTQPGEIETNCNLAGTTTVANLTSFVSLQPPPTVPVDVAIAQIINGEVDSTGKILELGSVSGGVPQPGQVVAGPGTAATPGESVAKSGRTTGLTCASVEAINTSAQVAYEKGCATTTSFTVTYSNQVTVGQTSNGNGFIAEGDSGSLMVDETTATPVALLFAGGDTTAIANPIGAVITALKDSSGNLPTFVGTATPHSIAGCSLPPPSADGVIAKGSSKTQAIAALTASVLQNAAITQDRNASALMSVSGVSAVGTGASLDSPTEAAMLVFLPRGASHDGVPAEVDGVRTRIVETDASSVHGALTQEQATQLTALSEQPQSITLTADQVTSATAVKEKHVASLMADKSVLGVGVALSLDSPGDPAIMIYVQKGQSHSAIPVTIDGVRTRIKETTPFIAGVARPRKTPAGCPVNGAPAKSPATSPKSSAAKLIRASLAAAIV